MALSNTSRINDNFSLWLYQTQAELTTTSTDESIKHEHN